MSASAIGPFTPGPSGGLPAPARPVLDPSSVGGSTGRPPRSRRPDAAGSAVVGGPARRRSLLPQGDGRIYIPRDLPSTEQRFSTNGGEVGHGVRRAIRGRSRRQAGGDPRVRPRPDRSMNLHPLCAARNALRYGLLAASTAFFLVALGVGTVDLDVALLFVLVPPGFLVGAVYGLVSYAVFRYELTADTFDLASGVLDRREREIPYGRVQNVDVRQSLLKRLLGLAVVRVETAGGGRTEAALDFVSASEAERIRAEIRERKRTGAGGERGEGPAPGTAGDEPTLLFELRPTELAVLSLAVLRPGALVVVMLAVPFADRAALDVLVRLARPLGGPDRPALAAITPDAALALVAVAVPLAALGTWLVSAVLTASTYYGFRLGRVGRDLVYDRGLLRRYGGSIPLSKVQTLTVTEPLLARPLGWAGLRVETAGYAPGRSKAAGPEFAVPLARRSRTLDLARTIRGFRDPAFARPPARARRRYAARYLAAVAGLLAASYAVSVAVGGFSRWYAPAPLVALVPVAAHLKWRNRGYHAGERHLLVREGFWHRTTTVVPYDRLQTVQVRRTVFQRRLGLASVVADTAGSPGLLADDATAFDLDAADAAELGGTCRRRLRSPGA